MIKVGSLLVDVSANVAHIKKDFNQIHREMKSFQYKAKRIFKTIGISFAGIFSVYAMYRWTKGTIQAIDTLEDLSSAAGMAMKEFGSLSYAAQFADVSMEKLQVATKTLAAYMLDAQMVGGSYRRYFDALGITIEDTSGKLRSTYDVILDISDKFKNMADGAEKTAIATRLMGRSGSMLIPVLNEGREALLKYMKEYERFGAYVAPEVAAKVDLVKKNFLKLKSNIEGISLNVMAGLVESLEGITSALVELRSEGDMFIKIGEGIGKALEYMMKMAFGLSGALELLGMHLGAGVAIMWTWVAEGTKAIQEMESLYNEKLDSILSKWTKLINTLKGSTIELPDITKTQDTGGGGITTKDPIKKTREEYEKQLAVLKYMTTQEETRNLHTFDNLKIAKDAKRSLESELDLHKKRLDYLDNTQIKNEQIEGEYIKIKNKIAEVNKEIKEQQYLIDSYSNMWQGAKAALLKYADEAKNLGVQMENIITDNIKRMEDILVDFVRTGKLQFKDLVNSILSDLARLAIRQFITAPLAGMFGLKFHQGGMVGLSPAPVQMMPATAYARAPRYHQGLKADEVPAILQKGEQVIKKEDAGKHLTISVPVTIGERNPLLASSLRESIENTVLDVLRRFS